MERLLNYLQEELSTTICQMDEIYDPENWDFDNRIEWERLEEKCWTLEDILNTVN